MFSVTTLDYGFVDLPDASAHVSMGEVEGEDRGREGSVRW